ncbi:IclR family transcriptional regulator [Gordonia rhizosphera]|uniref:Glycerol operon regulatory protein n=1 Tax=Gordonia rhizosphera NBRC 16068 TaxID=1108045 RepID=K6X2F4_9ACTN|nr:IclR family transcriptional regulator [Gordonia rhizosphera]GAB92979.1 putative IclR family transcriptional regulator [Gordonia rhizosphera NBRC 16068]
MSNPSSEATGGGVQSVDRAIQVLEILARLGEAGVTEVAADVGVHKSTASRLLSALEEREMVEQSQDRGKYRLGFGILRLASAVPAQLDITHQSRVVTERLAADLGETVNVAVLRSHYAVNVDQAKGPSAVSTQDWLGELTPLHATSSGKVLLAYLPEGSRHALLEAGGLERFTKRTITSIDDVDRELESVVGNGFAVCIEEFEEGLNAVAAPVRDHLGEVIAAISVSGPVYRLNEAKARECAPAVVSAAAEISWRMGYQG